MLVLTVAAVVMMMEVGRGVAQTPDFLGSFADIHSASSLDEDTVMFHWILRMPATVGMDRLPFYAHDEPPLSLWVVNVVPCHVRLVITTVEHAWEEVLPPCQSEWVNATGRRPILSVRTLECYSCEDSLSGSAWATLVRYGGQADAVVVGCRLPRPERGRSSSRGWGATACHPVQYTPFDLAMGQESHSEEAAVRLHTSLSHPFESRDLISQVRTLYEARRHKNCTSNARVIIPRVLHQVWLGSPPADELVMLVETFFRAHRHCGWTYVLWLDDLTSVHTPNTSLSRLPAMAASHGVVMDVQHVSSLRVTQCDLYQLVPNYGLRSDMVRVEVLERYGGVYSDLDFEWFEGGLEGILREGDGFVAGMLPMNSRYCLVSNGILAAKPHHPILAQILNHFLEDVTPPYRWRELSREKYMDTVLMASGPGLLTHVVFDYLRRTQQTGDAFLYPSTFFFPLFYNVPPSPKEAWLTPEALAVHYGMRSWFV